MDATTKPACAYKKPQRTRKKDHQVKLRFHHQALPQEYLQHFEATQNQCFGGGTKEISIGGAQSGQFKKDRSSTTLSSSSMAATLTTTTSKIIHPSTSIANDEHKINESVQTWLQKASEFQDNCETLQKDVQNSVEKCSINQAKSGASTEKSVSSRMVTYNDLPYMGEMTLENSKPRRGRKPKKADICHLIYKNYGTVLPNHKIVEQDDTVAPIKKAAAPATTATTTAQSKSVSSLLEKRLMQCKMGKATGDKNQSKPQGEEPLNLCVRDRYDGDIMAIISNDGNENEHENQSDSKADVRLLVSDDANSNPLYATNLKMALPNFQTALLDSNTLASNDNRLVTENSDILRQGCNYWSNSNMFLHPMALYFQKIANASSNFIQNPHKEASTSTELPQSQSSNLNATETHLSQMREPNLLIPKKLSQLLESDDHSNNGRPKIKSSDSLLLNSTKPAISQKSSVNVPPKRKRSAIFIPPLPEESSTNHATEVSICKFKFTGGAKPSLQEKKMLVSEVNFP